MRQHTATRKTLADHLDEPELAPRARAALANLLRGHPASAGAALYGALSIIGGIGLLVTGAYVWWLGRRPQ